MGLTDILNKELELYGIKTFVHPLYYSLPFGLRFELEASETEDINIYIHEVVLKISTIFKTAFTLDDKILLIFDTTPEKELKNALSFAKMQRIRTRTYKPFLDEDDTKTNSFFYRYLYYLDGRNFPLETIFSLIAGGEFSKNKSYSNNVYVFNLSKNLLLHMYDDRGADLLAVKKETLAPIYKKLNHFLLDHDREKMDKLFESI